MVRYENYIFMFGGIEDVTKEKNDIFIFTVETEQWSKIHTTTNAIYDCSPTLKRNDRVLMISFRKTKVHNQVLLRGYHLKSLNEE